jgi:hypothetical protein
MARRSITRQFFTAFFALPTVLNTGHNGYNAASWDFHLKSPPFRVVDGGSAAHYGYIPGGVAPTTDLAGNLRIQGGAPDMGAYETGGASGGASMLTYMVYNAKPQTGSSASYGYLTVNGAAQLGGVVPGAVVTVVATPVSSYTAGTITCRTDSGVNVSVTNGRFTIPAENVTVDATFLYSVGGGVGFGP